jgi:hypothetical protein
MRLLGTEQRGWLEERVQTVLPILRWVQADGLVPHQVIVYLPRNVMPWLGMAHCGLQVALVQIVLLIRATELTGLLPLQEMSYLHQIALP